MRKSWLGACLCALLLVVCAMAPGPSQAASPTVKIGSGTLTDPATALSGYNNPASPAAPATRDPLVQELARSLNYDIDRIFTHIRDHVEQTPIFGLQKGARGVILDNYGTDFDQAQAMVELLRESDAAGGTHYAPQYVFGRITLTAADFSGWFGVSDADAARRVLADGGIPATVSGSGSSFTVVMSHVWVTATVGGQVYAFDPSFKTHTTTTGVNVASAMSYSGSTLLTSGTSGASTNDATSIQGFNAANFRATLTTYRANLEGYIANPANGLVGAKLDNLIGHRSITPHPSSENRRTSLPNTSVDLTWTGQIPNAFRTSFSVMLPGWSAADLFYADEVYGKPLMYTYPSTASPYAGQSGPSIKPTLHIPTGGSVGNCDFYSDGGTASTTAVTIVITHPYASGNMNRTLTKNLSWRQCQLGRFILTNDWGDIGPKSTELMRVALEPLNHTNNAAKTDHITGPELEGVAAQYSNYLRVASQTLGGVYQLHDLIGIHQLDWVDNETNTVLNQQSGTETMTSSSAGLMLTMDFEGAVSVNPRTAVNAPARAGMIRVAHGGLAAAESGVARQESDSVRDITSLTLLTQQNTLAQTPGDYPYYMATPANWSGTVRPQVQSTYPAAALPLLDGYIAEGYSLLLPKQGLLRQQPYTVTYGNAVQTMTLLDTRGQLAGGGFPGSSRTVLYRPAFYAFNPSTGDGAYLIYDPRRRRIVKGGADVTVADPSANLLHKPDTPQPSAKDQVFDELSVNGRTGDLSYAPPPDITDGAGSFPQSLSIQRRYDAADTADYGFGVGWKTNWRQNVSLSNDGASALGGSGAFGAVSSIVAIQAVSDLAATAAANGSEDPQHLLAEAQIHAWFVDQTINNVATVASGVDGDEVFLRRADGTFLKAQPDGAQLVQQVQPTDSIIDRRIYQNVTFTYTGKTGDQRTYSYVIDPSFVHPDTLFFVSYLSRKTFHMNGWTFPSGVKVTPTYTWYNYNDTIVLASVSNSFGRALTLSSFDFGDMIGSGSCDAAGNYTQTSPPRTGAARYRNASGVDAIFGRAAVSGTILTCQPYEPGAPSSSGHIDFVQRPTGTFVTDQVGNTWTYGYAPLASTYPDSGSGNVQTNLSLVRLSAIYRPSAPSPATPTASISMGLDGQVRTITDALGNVHSYYPSAFFTNQVDPLGASTRTVYDEYGRAISVTDANEHTSNSQYDLRDRLILSTAPEGDSVARTYDARSNLLTVTRHAKPGSTLADIVSSVTWMEGSNVIACTTIAICNQPAGTTDARGNTTNYSWNGATGQLTQILAPADSNGQRPQTDFAYSSVSVGGATVSLLTSKTQKIDATTSVVTAYAYNSTNKYVPQTITNDQGGLNLTTSLTFDAVGNLTAVTDARGKIANFAWDLDRRPTFMMQPSPDGTRPRPAQKYVYDIDNNLIEADRGTVGASVTDGSGFTPIVLSSTTWAFDAGGRKILETNPATRIQYSYDAADRPICTAVRMNPAIATASLPADACALSTPTGANGLDRITKSTYDPVGQLIETRRALHDSNFEQAYATYAYTPNGKQLTVKDADGDVTHYVYDGFDRLHQTDFPSKALASGTYSATAYEESCASTASVGQDFERYCYDPFGNRTTLRKRDGNLIGFSYDALNREVSKTLPSGPAVNTAYDLLSRKLYAHTGVAGQGVDYVWDKAGRLTSETTNQNGFSRAMTFQYDAAGNRTQVGWPGSDNFYAAYVYDADNRMTGVCQQVTVSACGSATTLSQGLLVTYAYDDLGRRTSVTRTNGTSTTATLDTADRPTIVNLVFPNSASNQTWTFSYNPASQALGGNSSNDLFKWVNHPSQSTSKTYDGLNRDAGIAAVNATVQVPCSPSTGYDCNGNLANEGSGGRTFAYDAENRLTQAVQSATTLNLAYDPLGRLNQTSVVGGTSTQFLYDGDRLSAEYDGVSGLLQRRYIHGPGVDEPLVWYDTSGQVATRNWLHADRQGSIVGWSNDQGVITSSNVQAYGPYGEPQSWSGSRFAYTGQLTLPEVKLYYYKAREYDPAMGRFLQTDPVGYKADMDLYAYVQEDPLNRSDSTGKDPDSPEKDAVESAAFRTCPDMNCVIIKMNTWELEDAHRNKIRGTILKEYALFAGGGWLIDSIRGAIWGRRAVKAAEVAGAGEEVLEEVNIGRKVEYMLGRATGSAHNLARTRELASTLRGVGLEDNPWTREYLETALRTAYDSPGVLQADGAVAREMLLAGPAGFLRMKTIWRGKQLITVYLFPGAA